ncbi:capsid cement protein, partial [Paraburkholderia sp. SIMBA_054]|uniref:capsid cement protein n=1 Tax=Paraburkholderia sp. SIMBA_054 TaxID=3085795 RepID=UPI003978C9D8
IITVPAPAGGATSGVPFAYGSLLAIPVTDAPEGDPVAVAIERAFVLPKLSSAVITGGAKLHWDVSAGQVVIAGTAAGDLQNFGVAIAG